MQEEPEVLEEQRRLKAHLANPLQTCRQAQEHVSERSKTVNVYVVAGSYRSARKLCLCSRTPGNSLAVASPC